MSTEPMRIHSPFFAFFNSALKVIHRNEALDRRSRRRADGSGKNGKKSDEEEEDEDDEEEGGNKLLPEDKDGDGVPDNKQRAS